MNENVKTINGRGHTTASGCFSFLITARRLPVVATIVAICGGLTCLNDASAAGVVYEYQGDAYTVADGPFTTSMRITGSLTFDAALAPNLSEQDITVGVQSFSFSDGLHTISGPTLDFFYVYAWTDASGDLTQWAMAFVHPSPPHAEDYQIEVINAVGWGFVDLASINTDPFPTARSDVPGTFTLVPEPSSLALLGLGGLLIARRRRR